jgi:hypothetical protein
MEARAMFGTPEQNQYSVITAIKHNPTAYLARTPRLATAFIRDALGAYGSHLALWFFMLGLLGCVELVHRRELVLLSTLALWSSYLVIYLLLVFQPTHLLLPFPVVFALASVGLTALPSSSNQQRYICSSFLVLIVAVAIGRDASQKIIGSTMALLIGFWIVWMIWNRYADIQYVTNLATALVLGLMMLFKSDVPEEKFRKLGLAPDEQGVLFLEKHFPQGTPVAAYDRKISRAAKMHSVALHKSRVDEMRSDLDLLDWIEKNNVQAIYIDNHLEQFESGTWSLIEKQIGKHLEPVFSADSESEHVRIFAARLNTAPEKR